MTARIVHRGRVPFGFMPTSIGPGLSDSGPARAIAHLPGVETGNIPAIASLGLLHLHGAFLPRRTTTAPALPVVSAIGVNSGPGKSCSTGPGAFRAARHTFLKPVRLRAGHRNHNAEAAPKIGRSPKHSRGINPRQKTAGRLLLCAEGR